MNFRNLGDLKPNTMSSLRTPAATSTLATPSSVPSAWIQILVIIYLTHSPSGDRQILPDKKADSGSPHPEDDPQEPAKRHSQQDSRPGFASVGVVEMDQSARQSFHDPETATTPSCPIIVGLPQFYMLGT